MAIHLAGNLAKRILRQSVFPPKTATLKCSNVPKEFLAVYIGEIKNKRFVVPLSYLKEPSFQDLLSKAEEEFWFDHPMGGLTIPCRVDTFLHITSSLSRA